MLGEHKWSFGAFGQKSSQSPLTPGVVVVAAATIFLLRPSIWQDDFLQPSEADFLDTSQRISHEAWSGNSSLRRTTRALRGAGAIASMFRWDFPADAMVEVGSILRTRIVALDTAGHPAKLSSCSQLDVKVNLSGHARLVHSVENLSWNEGELYIELVNDIVEKATGEIRITRPGASTDTFFYLAEFEFVAGPPEDFALSLRPLGAAPIPYKALNQENNSVGIWPTQAVIDVAMEVRDRFGNPTTFKRPRSGDLKYRPSQFALRSNSPALKVLNFFRVDVTGEARARIRGVRPGPAELWLEHNEGMPLRDKTLVRLEVIGPAEQAPSNFTKAAKISQLSHEDATWQELANDVRKEFMHAWQGYKKYAWGADELQPLSKKGKDVFGNIGISILDSLSSLWLMGLPEEFEAATDWVSTNLDFAVHRGGKAREVSVFEVIIRALGGLLSAYTLSGRQVFLDKAIDLGDRLLPAFNTSSGMPYPRWDIAQNRGTKTTDPTILAEAGSMQLEFRTLTALTGDVKYKNAADAATSAIRQAGRGLLPVHLTPPDQFPPRAMVDNIQMGALADSYYEYLLKQWIQSPAEAHLKNMWLDMMEALPTLVHGEGKGKHSPLRLLERTGKGKTLYKQDHLSCFTPGMIALGLHGLPDDDLSVTRRNKTEWLDIAEGLVEGCAEMWTYTQTGLAPEYTPIQQSPPFNLQVAPSQAAHSFLRPETAESLFYLYRATGNSRYRKLGKKMFNALVKHARVDAGYATVADVNRVPAQKLDEMQSFVLSETFKYLYLLFSPVSQLDLDSYVLNTEGHPLPKLGPF